MPIDLSLPDPPPAKGRRLIPALTFAGVLLLLAGVAVLIFSQRQPEPPLLGRDLAETLERRTLWREAAALWEELARTDDRPAGALFRAGKCRMLAGEAERGVRNLLAAEELGLPEDLAAESSRLVLEAYAVLGKLAVRNEALARRTGGDGDEGPAVVARVGGEEITREELDAAVRDEESGRLLMTGGLDREALEKAVAARAADATRAVPTLERLLTRRALSLEALANGLGDAVKFERRLAEARRELLGNLLLEKRLLEGVLVSQADLEDHHRAHPDRYTEPEAVRFSHGPEGTPPEEFEKAAAWHEKGAPYPDGLGRSAEADALLFALSPGEVALRPVAIGGKRILLRLDEKRPSRLLPFAEARDRVTRDLLTRRRTEVIGALREEVKSRHEVEILDPDIRKAYEEVSNRDR